MRRLICLIFGHQLRSAFSRRQRYAVTDYCIRCQRELGQPRYPARVRLEREEST